MKYRLAKSLPGIEVGTIYDTNVNGVTKQDIDLELFVRNFGTDNDFFEPIKEPKYWEPEEGEYYYDIHSEYGKHGGYDCDDVNISAGLAFKTKEEAEKQLKLMQAITRCRKYLVEHDMLLTSEEALNDDGSQYKYVQYMYGDHIETTGVENCLCYSPYGYINSRTNAEKFINDCEEDLKTIHSPI